MPPFTVVSLSVPSQSARPSRAVMPPFTVVARAVPVDVDVDAAVHGLGLGVRRDARRRDAAVHRLPDEAHARRHLHAELDVDVVVAARSCDRRCRARTCWACRRRSGIRRRSSRRPRARRPRSSPARGSLFRPFFTAVTSTCAAARAGRGDPAVDALDLDRRRPAATLPDQWKSSWAASAGRARPPPGPQDRRQRRHRSSSSVPTFISSLLAACGCGRRPRASRR